MVTLLGGEELDTMKQVIGFLCGGHRKEKRLCLPPSPGQSMSALVGDLTGQGSRPAVSSPSLQGLGSNDLPEPGVVEEGRYFPKSLWE